MLETLVFIFMLIFGLGGFIIANEQRFDKQLEKKNTHKQRRSKKS